MRCFTVHEEGAKGIFAEEVEGNPCVIVGGTRVPLSREMALLFYQSIHEMERVVELEQNGELINSMGNPIELDPAVRHAYDDAISCRKIKLLRAHPVDGELCRSRSHKDNRALVLMEASCGEGGELWLQANSYSETLVNGAIERGYDAFPPPGIEVVAYGSGPGGEPHGLFVMHRGASFRIGRSGDFGGPMSNPGQGTSPVLVVSWTGGSLKVFPPAKYAAQAAS